MNLQTIVLLFLSALLFTGCYPATLAPSEENMRSKQVAPPPGKALVYFYLDYGTHDLIDVAVSLHGYGGRISKYTYMLWEVFPGEYLLAFDSSKDQELEIKCEANQIYYYHNVYKHVFNQKLTQASDATGRAKINELSLVKWFKDVPAPPKSRARIAAEVAELAKPEKMEVTAQVPSVKAIDTEQQNSDLNVDSDKIDEDELKSADVTKKMQEIDSAVAEDTDSAPTESDQLRGQSESTAVVISLRPTSTPVRFAIRDPKFEATYKSECDTDATISSVEGDSFGAGGQISIRNGELTLWCYGAKHTWKGRLTYAGHVFDSDSESPLQFMIDKDKGYVYLTGKGTVTLPDGTAITLPVEDKDRSAVSPRSKSSALLEGRLDDIPTAQQADDSNTKSDGAEKDTVRSTSPQQIRIPFSKEHVIKVEGISDLVGTGKASFEMGEDPNTIRVEITNKVKIINDKSTCMFAVETILIAPHAHVPVSLFIEKDLGDYSGIKTLRKSDLKFHYAIETVKATDGRQYRVMKKPPVREELEINGLFAVQLKVEDERFLLAGPDGASLKKVDDGFILLDGEAYISRGGAYKESGQYKQAISDNSKAIELNPKDANAYYNRGIAYYELSKYKQAISDFTKAIELNLKHANIYSRRGAAYRNVGQYTQAISDHTKAIELNPKYAKAYYNRGIVHYESGQYTQAISDHSKAIELDPKFAEAYHNRGISYRKSGQHTQAISDHTKTIELNPKFAKAYYSRGKAYYESGKRTDAITDYTKAIELDPKDVEAYFNRGNAYYESGQYKQAISDYSKAIELNPKDVETYFNRGNAYYRSGQHGQAISDYTKTIELSPKFADAYISRGAAYRESGQCTEAISDYTKVIELNPKYAKAYYNRGIAYKESGQYRQAISDYTKAIELNPKDVEAYINRGIVYRELNQHKQAISDYTEAIELNPNEPRVYYNRGIAYVVLGQYMQAISDLTQAIELNPQYAKAYAYRGIAYAYRGNTEEAKNDLVKTVELSPDLEPMVKTASDNFKLDLKLD